MHFFVLDHCVSHWDSGGKKEKAHLPWETFGFKLQKPDLLILTPARLALFCFWQHTQYLLEVLVHPPACTAPPTGAPSCPPHSLPVSTDGRFKKKTTALVDYYPSTLFFFFKPLPSWHSTACSVVQCRGASNRPPRPRSPLTEGCRSSLGGAAPSCGSKHAARCQARRQSRIRSIISATSRIDDISFMPAPHFFSLSALSSFRCRYKFEKPHTSYFFLYLDCLTAFVTMNEKSPSSTEVAHTVLGKSNTDASMSS